LQRIVARHVAAGIVCCVGRGRAFGIFLLEEKCCALNNVIVHLLMVAWQPVIFCLEAIIISS